MTLLDAPKFDAARERRKALILRISAAALLVLFVAWWLVAGRPIDWPWNWNHYLFGRAKVNAFLTAVEANDLAKAYGIWVNDKDWQQHLSAFNANPYDRFLASKGYAGKADSLDKNLAKRLAREYGEAVHDKDWQRQQTELNTYPFSRFQDDWSSTSPDNEYGAIKSHRIALAGRYGNGVLVAIFINGRKSDALDLAYDPSSGQLSFAPPGVNLYLGP